MARSPIKSAVKEWDSPSTSMFMANESLNRLFDLKIIALVVELESRIVNEQGDIRVIPAQQPACDLKRFTVEGLRLFMIARVIRDEFSVTYHPGHVRKLLHQLGYSVQQLERKLMRANPEKQDRWHRYTYPNLKKTQKRKARR